MDYMKIEAKTQKTEDKSVRSNTKQEIVRLIQNYLQILDSMWEVSQEKKEEEYKRLKSLIKYQLTLSSPLPLATTVMEQRDDANKNTEVTDGVVRIPPNLRPKLAVIAKELNCTEDEAALVALSQGIEGYGEEDDADEGDDVLDA